jgi:hypothetical protein
MNGAEMLEETTTLNAGHCPKNGCDPKEAAKELRIYAAAIRARGNK